VDQFILVEANTTHPGKNKIFFFEENKWRYEKWIDKIIHLKVNFPLHLDTWGREKYQRNSIMPTLYSLGLSNDDIVVISDLDEIPDSSTLNYIKTSYPMKGLFKLEMDHYWASIYNKLVYPEKWYHAKIVDWETLKGRTPDECRLDFNCQWWERGGWHLSYFGGPEIIINKINSTAHQELNQERFKIKDEVIRKVKEGLDLFDEWRTFQKIDPLENTYLPKNWGILSKNEEKYGNKIKNKNNLVLGAAINLSLEDIRIFVDSFRSKNLNDDVYLIIEESASQDKLDYLKKNSVEILSEKNTYKNVLLSDVSDVYFQSDPFDGLDGEFIFFAEEDESESIGSNKFNSRWIIQCFGEEYLEKIKNEKIVCCGTIVGSYGNILKYCKKSSSEMIRMYNERKDFFYDMMDQGIHNYICYNSIEDFVNPSIKKNGDFFATIGITCGVAPESIEVNELKIHVNKKIPSVIHQYNRSREITDSIKTLLQLEGIGDKVLETKIEGFSILTLSNDAIGRGINKGESWEPHIVSFLRNYLDKESVFVDIGSNYGWHSLIASSLCKTVHSFEPQSLIYSLQKESIRKNKFENIIQYKKGLGSIITQSNLSPINYHENGLNIGDLGVGLNGENIEIITLDSINIEKVDLIKIDVQGYENFVIEGATKTIEKNRPIIIIEIEEFQLSKFGFSSANIFEKIRGLNYEIYLMEHSYPSDHICVPLEKADEFEKKNNIDPLTENNNISNSYANGVRKKFLKSKKSLSGILDFNRINGFDSEGGTDKGTLHSYIETYERILSKYIGKKSSILEVGVQYGGSSLLWHEYLEDSNLVMADIKDQIGKNILDRLNQERYKFHIFDAYTKESLEKIKEENPEGFDILIDDGPHTLESQKFFIKNYISLAKENSVMIIEDIQDINHTAILKECLPEEYRESIEIIDLRNQKNRYDDIMFIVHIGDKKYKSSNLDFTFGWISHNKEAFEKYLGPSLEKIDGKYQSISTDDSKNPAYNYNKIISECKTKWLILCHEDVAFSNDLLDQIKETVKLNPDSKFFGMAGSNGNQIISSDSKESRDILTADSCFIVIDTENLDLNFDENTFDDFHLYVEDFCVQLGENGKTILCDYTEPYNYPDEKENKKKWILHGGSTYFQLGSQWGRYKEYKEKLNKKWGREIPTT